MHLCVLITHVSTSCYCMYVHVRTHAVHVPNGTDEFSVLTSVVSQRTRVFGSDKITHSLPLSRAHAGMVDRSRTTLWRKT